MRRRASVNMRTCAPWLRSCASGSSALRPKRTDKASLSYSQSAGSPSRSWELDMAGPQVRRTVKLKVVPRTVKVAVWPFGA